jgi:hypothetical protein
MKLTGIDSSTRTAWHSLLSRIGSCLSFGFGSNEEETKAKNQKYGYSKIIKEKGMLLLDFSLQD